ncbi:hypothetical protein BG004_005815 [Podila humilis]|nr:hypothetical protein BG004_005815 [Podila humilis]
MQSDPVIVTIVFILALFLSLTASGSGIDPPSNSSSGSDHQASNPNSPGAVAGSSFASQENDALYIYNGVYQSTRSNILNRDLFFRLDLSTAWASTDPAWKRLTLRNQEYLKQDFRYERFALGRDGSAIFVGTYIQDALADFTPYNTRQNVWMPSYKTETIPDKFQLGTVTDLDTGLIYDIKAENESDCRLSAFDPSNGKKTTDVFYCANFGSNLETNSPQGTYSKAKKNSVRKQHIYLTAAYGGSKLILAGGLSQSANPRQELVNAALRDVYMLDVASMVWTKLLDLPVQAYDAACAVSGDYLVIYGGYSSYSFNRTAGVIVTSGSPPTIFNIKDNDYVSDYKPHSSSSAQLPTRNNLHLGIPWVTALGYTIMFLKIAAEYT